MLASREELGRAYQRVDVCLVTSRQEGGPKAVLEAMASGVPLVSTRVGQAAELVGDGENGLLADVDDVDALVAAVQRVHDDAALRRRLRSAGRVKAEANAEERLDPLWARLLEGFVQPCGLSRYAARGAPLGAIARAPRGAVRATRVLRPRPRPRAGRGRRRRLGQVPAPRTAVPEQP